MGLFRGFTSCEIVIVSVTGWVSRAGFKGFRGLPGSADPLQFLSLAFRFHRLLQGFRLCGTMLHCSWTAVVCAAVHLSCAIRFCMTSIVWS